MEDHKSKIIYLQDHKPSISQTNKDNLSETKIQGRVNHIADACSKSGHYSRVPNCIYEMGLSWQERELWMYFNRLPHWEHPTVESVHKTLSIGKAPVLLAFERLCSLNMLVVEGEGRGRKFHIPHPCFWKHEIPKMEYAAGADEEKPLDIGQVFNGVVVKRSKQNVPNRTNGNVPNRTDKRSKQNEKTAPNVLNRTFQSQQTHAHQGSQGCCKTSSKDLIRLNNPGEVGQMNLPGAGRISIERLEGAMLSLYDRYTKPKVIGAVIRAMLDKDSKENVLEVIEKQREAQQGLIKWDPSHMGNWLVRLAPPAAESNQVIEEFQYEQDDTPFPNDCPY